MAYSMGLFELNDTEMLDIDGGIWKACLLTLGCVAVAFAAPLAGAALVAGAVSAAGAISAGAGMAGGGMLLIGVYGFN
ncbi:MAG: hypothetical protein GX271_01710 [Clostridiales bacterium]|jgi:hypothetical protein|nr:hypothetical protein [Clostridiales bacterium]